MATIDTSTRIRGYQGDPQDVLDFIEHRLKASLQVKKSSCEGNTLTVEGQARGNVVLFSFTSFSVEIAARSDERGLALSTTGKSEPNSRFWVVFVLGLALSMFVIGLFLIALAVIGFFMRSKEPGEMIERALRAAEHEFGS